MPSQAQIRDEVTARIVQALEADLLPWRRPWRAAGGGSQPGRHSNVASRKPDQGVRPRGTGGGDRLVLRHRRNWRPARRGAGEPCLVAQVVA
jgi:hypothetical protein